MTGLETSDVGCSRESIVAWYPLIHGLGSLRMGICAAIRTGSRSNRTGNDLLRRRMKFGQPSVLKDIWDSWRTVHVVWRCKGGCGVARAGQKLGGGLAGTPWQPPLPLPPASPPPATRRIVHRTLQPPKYPCSPSIMTSDNTPAVNADSKPTIRLQTPKSWSPMPAVPPASNFVGRLTPVDERW